MPVTQGVKRRPRSGGSVVYDVSRAREGNIATRVHLESARHMSNDIGSCASDPFFGSVAPTLPVRRSSQLSALGSDERETDYSPRRVSEGEVMDVHGFEAGVLGNDLSRLV